MGRILVGLPRENGRQVSKPPDMAAQKASARLWMARDGFDPRSQDPMLPRQTGDHGRG